ncbi:nucleotidyltransferase domain-containing protein [Virgibacillus dakarensis]|nr:nucleotidyltransferase domain-containing protein [Virgibacillus dakarensis]
MSEIAGNRGIYDVKVFGSVARLEDDTNSDVDFIVSFEKGRSLFDLIGFKDVVEELLNKSVDVVTEQSVHESIFLSLAGIEDPLSDKGSFRHVPCPIM